MTVRAWAICFLAAFAWGQDDVADIPSEDVTVGKDKNKRYFRMGPKKGAKKPRKGYGLVVILPGGGGGAGFHAWCKRIYKNALDESFVAVQPVAFQWSEGQQIVWPTEKNKVKGQKFSTEKFVADVIADAKEWQKIDPARIYVLAWSSSGPAAYAISLAKKKAPTGFFVAMSVFKREQLPTLKEAKREAYFIYHSRGDRVCPFRMAKDAEKQLSKKGAKVKFVEYQGGHGWGHGNLWANLKGGFAWLEKNHGKPLKAKQKR